MVKKSASKSKAKEPTPVEEDDEVYEVEDILDHRLSQKSKNGLEYYIKWKNYSHRHNTWEREANIYAKGLLKSYWEKQPETKEEAIARLQKEKTQKKQPAATEKVTTQASAAERSPATRSAVASASKKLKKTATGEEATPVTEDMVVESPPDNMTWNDIKEITSVVQDVSDELFAVVKWKNGEISYCPTRIIGEQCPRLILDYYESNLTFEKQ